MRRGRTAKAGLCAGQDRIADDTAEKPRVPAIAEVTVRVDGIERTGLGHAAKDCGQRLAENP